jgi:hypothetical protein
MTLTTSPDIYEQIVPKGSRDLLTCVDVGVNPVALQYHPILVSSFVVRMNRENL